ncbi:GspE/PulE family protein [Piscinibacter defluvii]|uniref:GspE/PulE family protein n=1 Tax=Piscinibacter defluvii TaxID=1796922 RepID=UPI0035C17468
MAEMLSPLAWDPPPLPRAVPDKLGRPEFLWPAPPFASYPPPAAQTDPLPCEITGLNDKTLAGRLTFFVPEEAVAHVQIPPARTTLPLRFDQFRALTLTTPLAPLALPAGDPHAAMLGQRGDADYRVKLADGGELAGRTVGHVETEHGLFLFPPAPGAAGDDGAVLRRFVPRSAYSAVELGPRIGELLVQQNSATPQQVEQAVDLQNDLRGRKLGDILLARQVVTPEQLLEAVARQANMPMVRIGDALISLGMINDAQLQEALAQQQGDRSVPLGELLVRMGVVSRQDLQVALSRKMGYPLVDLDLFPVEAEALRAVPYATARRLKAMPLLLRDGRLIVALDDPARRRAAVEEVEFVAQMKAVPVLAQCRDIEDLLDRAYARIGSQTGGADGVPAIEFQLTGTGELIEQLEREGAQRPGGFDEDAAIEQSDNSLVRLINTMIVEAHQDGVSDIHIESYPGREKIRIRFRKDGLLRTYLELPSSYRNALVARVKIMCDLDISEKRKPQDGKINFAKFSPQHRIELRVATIPTNGGLEDVVMRILASAKPIPLDKLGMAPRNLAELKRVAERPYGMVLCVGPTGSGKTTTLHSVLSHINVPERKIWTAEDPVEITQPGLRQVQVNPKIGWTFAGALRAFLRADPDVIMVGEIRDQETAQTAIEASLTGHLVLSTLHTNSAPETVTRLLDMGMDPFNFADALLAILAQRLVRRICPQCRSTRAASDDEFEELMADWLHVCPTDDPRFSRDILRADWLARFGQGGRLMLHQSPGCPACDGTGKRGRAGLHELLVVSRELRHLIQTGARAEELQRCALLGGMRTLRQDGIEKVLQGITSLDEVRATSNA